VLETPNGPLPLVQNLPLSTTLARGATFALLDGDEMQACHGCEGSMDLPKKMRQAM
jgi:hypothetical protein